MSTYEEKIAQNILSKLNTMNMNYTEFCQKCGIGHAEISKMKNNPKRITIPFLLSVANGLGCSYADLFRSGKGTMPNLIVGRTYLQRIRERREKMGYSTKQMALLLDVRTNSYEYFEMFGSRPGITPEKFEKLLKLLELNYLELRGKVTDDHAKQQQLFTEEPKPEEKAEEPEIVVPIYQMVIDGKTHTFPFLIAADGKVYKMVLMEVKEAK